jgi:hypothetical protein
MSRNVGPDNSEQVQDASSTQKIPSVNAPSTGTRHKNENMTNMFPGCSGPK